MVGCMSVAFLACSRLEGIVKKNIVNIPFETIFFCLISSKGSTINHLGGMVKNAKKKICLDSPQKKEKIYSRGSPKKNFFKGSLKKNNVRSI